jgi:hypothetical protein
MPDVIAPGALIEVRDALWRVLKVDRASTGRAVWTVTGVSSYVQDEEAVFLEDYEPAVRVLAPEETKLVTDTSAQHRGGLLYLESLLQDLPPPDDALVIGHKGAFDPLPYQLDPARQALSALRAYPDRRRGWPRQDARGGRPSVRADPAWQGQADPGRRREEHAGAVPEGAVVASSHRRTCGRDGAKPGSCVRPTSQY